MTVEKGKKEQELQSKDQLLQAMNWPLQQRHLEKLK